MKAKKNLSMLLVLVLMLSIVVPVYADNVDIDFAGQTTVTISGTSDYTQKPVTLTVYDRDKDVYQDQSLTDINGNYNFIITVDKGKQYTGKVKIKGKVKEFSFTTKGKKENNFGEEIKPLEGEILFFQEGIKLDLGDLRVDDNSRVIVDEKNVARPKELNRTGKIIEVKFKNINVDRLFEIGIPINSDNIDKVSLYYYDLSNQKWEYKDSDKVNNLVLAQVSREGVYGVFEDVQEPQNVKVELKKSTAKKVVLNLYAEDISGIKMYEVYRDGNIIGYSNSENYVDTQVSKDENYKYQIKAVDKLGNVSEISSNLCVEVKGSTLEPEKKVNVSIRIEGYNSTVLYDDDLEVDVFGLDPFLTKADQSKHPDAKESNGWPKERFSGPTVAHALVQALKNDGKKASKDYDFEDYGWSCYLSRIGKDKEFAYKDTSGWMYRVNGWLPNYGCQDYVLEDGDEIEWFFGVNGFLTWFTEFDADKTEVAPGEEVTLTLNGEITKLNKKSGRGKTITKKISGATIYVNNKDKDLVTDSNGQVTLKFDKAGKYEIAAERIDKKGYKDIFRPIPITITVKGESSSIDELNTVELDKRKVTAGEDVKVNVHIGNYEKAENPNKTTDYKITLYKDGKKQVKAVEVKASKTDKNGNSSYKFTIPEDKKAGDYKLKIEILRCKKEVFELPITVEASENISNPDYDEDNDKVSNEDSSEEDVIKACENATDKLDEKADEVTSNEDAEELVSDAKDVSKILNKAAERVETEEGAKDVANENINVIKSLLKSTKIVTDDSTKKKITEIVTDNMDTSLMLMDKIQDEKAIDKIANDMIESAGKLAEDIGEGNTKELEQKAVEIAEKVISKMGTQMVDKGKIEATKNKAVAKVDVDSITSMAKKLIDKVEKMEQKLADNNIDMTKELEKKLSIEVPETGKHEVETSLLPGVMDKVLANGVDNVAVRTEIASFSITPNTFGDKAKGKEISLKAKKVNNSEISVDARQEIPQNSIIIDLDAKVGQENIANFEQPIKISIPYEAKVGNGEKVTVFFIKDDGTIEPVGGIYDPVTKTVKFITNHFSKYFAKEAVKTFKDSANHWAKNEIEIMAGKGIFSGRNDQIFDPNANITRAEFATLITRMLKYTTDNSGEIPFDDIDKNVWYYNSVVVAYEKGLINGKSATKFDPEGNITRQEIAKIIANVLEKDGYKKADKKELNGFRDKSKIATWAKEASALVVREGIINGIDNNNFAPTENATRAQTAKMLYELYKLIMK